jgi:hypothetical protein
MHTLESQAVPLDVLHTSDKGRFRKAVRHGAFRWKTPDLNIMHFVAEFSKKELGHPADALNAMQGIFQMFHKAKTPIYHIEGVPLVPNQSRAFVTEDCFIQGLSWYHEKVGERRLEFPSWSWAGWTGLLANRGMVSGWPTGPCDISIRLEYENEIIEDFPKENEWQDFLSKIASIRVKFLHIKGQTLKCSLVRTANEFGRAALKMDFFIEHFDYVLKFEMEKNTVIYCSPLLDLDGSQIEGKPLECICLRLEAEKELSAYRVATSLLIATNTDGVSERVGIFHNYRFCMQDGERVSLDEDHEGVFRGMLEKKLQLRTIRLG